MYALAFTNAFRGKSKCITKLEQMMPRGSIWLPPHTKREQTSSSVLVLYSSMVVEDVATWSLPRRNTFCHEQITYTHFYLQSKYRSFGQRIRQPHGSQLGEL